MVSYEDLIGANVLICESSDKPSVVINEDNLLSALGTQQWYDDDRLKASALIRSITIGHGFQDGNKRTASLVGAFIREYTCTQDEMIKCILNIAKGELRDVEEIASILYK